MAKLNYLSRYNLIIKKLKKAPASFEVIFRFLEQESEISGQNLRISKRTFQRDIEEILSLYDIEIKYDFSRKVYFITDDFQSETNMRMLDAFDLFQSLKMSEKMKQNICFEKRKPQGTQFLSNLLQAIKYRNVIELLHQKFSEEWPFLHKLEPLAIKESQGRWYLIANEIGKNKIKTYGLDRVHEVTIMKQKFNPIPFDVDEYYKDCFGIIRPEDEEFASVFELIFNKNQGYYIKTYHLHHSQKLIEDDENETKFSYKMYITYDLIKEIVSYGKSFIKSDSIEINAAIKEYILT